MIKTKYIPGRTFTSIDGENWLYFAGTAYLGMPHYDTYKKAVQKGLEKYGANYGASRASLPEIPLFCEMEEKLANLVEAPAATLVSSGTLSGQSAVRFFKDTHTCYFSPDAHPAITTNSEPSEITSFGEWLSHTIENINRRNREAAIFCNAIDPLGVNTYDFSELNQLIQPERVTLVVDDSHALGITHQGRGSYAHLSQKFPNLSLIVTASTGKAWGLPAGILFGNTTLISNLKQQPFFRGASPPLPAYLYGFDEVITTLKTQLGQLQKNIHHLHQQLGHHPSIKKIKDYPVTAVSIPNLDLYAAKEKILISAFPYPDVNAPKINRLVVNALHTYEDINTLSQLIKKYL